MNGAGRAEPILECTGLSKQRGARLALQEASISVHAGEVVALVGPNGAGKTTLLKTILGLARPSAGSVRLFGLDGPPGPTILTRVGAMIEEPAFYPWLSGPVNLRVLSAGGPPLPQERYEATLERVNLARVGPRPVKAYSQGMRQRLGLALALLREPRLLLLDEPANGLDPEGIAALRRLLLELKDEGVGILLASHLLDEVARTADRVVLMQAGRIVDERRGDQVRTGETLETWMTQGSRA